MSDDPTTPVCVPLAYPPVLSFDPAWRTETVMALAHGIDAEAHFDRMPILADALQEAGCEDEKVLNHCRLCDGHDRDCWVIRHILDRYSIPQPLDDPRIIAILREAAQPSPAFTALRQALARQPRVIKWLAPLTIGSLFGMYALLIAISFFASNRGPNRTPTRDPHDTPLFQTSPTFDFQKQQELAEQLVPRSPSTRP